MINIIQVVLHSDIATHDCFHNHRPPCSCGRADQCRGYFRDWIAGGYVVEAWPVGIEASLVTETDATDGTKIEFGPGKDGI
jgi:hypothetical protein